MNMHLGRKRRRDVKRIRTYTKKRWKRIGLTGLVFMFLAVSAGLVLEYRELKASRQQTKLLEEQLASYRRTVPVAGEKLSKGSILTEETVYWEIRYMDLPQEDFITEESLGMAVNQDVEAGSCLTTVMLCTAEENRRELFLTEIDVPEYMEAGDRVDVRIQYANAEDYIVLVDKTLVRCSGGKGIVVELTEEEILLLSSAMADKRNYSGTQLYAVRYPDFAHQESGSSNYIANREILVLLDREKTEGESRDALEKRLMQ